MEKKKKRGLSRLEVKILLSVFFSTLILQLASATIAFFVVSRQVLGKRNEDMSTILGSIVYHLSSPYYGDEEDTVTNPNYRRLTFLIDQCSKAYTNIYPDYKEKYPDMTVQSPEYKEYLSAFDAEMRRFGGLGMSQDGDSATIVNDLLSALAAPTNSKYIYVGYLDEATGNMVVVNGSFDYRNFGGYEQDDVYWDVVEPGYYFPWAKYGDISAYDPENDCEDFLGGYFEDPVKGKYYAYGARLKFDGKESWIVCETDVSFFSDEITDFIIIFAVTGASGLLAMFISIGAAIHFLFLRRINRISSTAQKAVSTLEKGELRVHFEKDEKKHPDEVDGLNNDIAYLEGKLVDYLKLREDEIKKEEKNRAELIFSQQIQLSSLPSAPIDNDRVSIHARIELAKQVGGDLYDYFLVGENRAVFLIGDVSGKGVPAALFMMQSFAKIKAALSGEFDLGKAIKTINDEISSRNPMSLFITAFIGLIELDKGLLTYVNCGHEEIFYRHNGVYKKLTEAPNLPLGAVEGFEYQSEQLTLTPGDALYLYTDGVSEAEDIHGEFFGKQRIEESLNELPYLPSELVVASMLKKVNDFQAGKDAADDICMVSLSYMPSKCITLNNDVAELSKMQDFLYDALSAVPNKAAVSEISLAMDELVGNVVHYAYGEGKGTLDFHLSVDENGHTVHGFLVDSGKEFDPLKKEANQDVANVAGGLGILIAKDVLDKISYHRLLGFNVLYFNKKY